MNISRVADRILEAHLRSKRRRGRTYRPELLKKLSTPPRKDEGDINYSIDGDLDQQYTAPGAFSGDFGAGGGGTQHATRVRYVAGQTDAASGKYFLRNDQPMALDSAMKSRKVRLAIQQAVAAAREALDNQRSSYEKWARDTLEELDTVSSSNADHLILTPITMPDGRLRVRAVCESCGAAGEAGPGQLAVVLHDEMACRLNFCAVCNGRAVERGAECAHGEGKIVFFTKERGIWREMRGTPEMVEEACR